MHVVSFSVPSHSRGCDSGSQPSALARGTFQVFLRSLPTLVYSIGGAVDAEGAGGDGDSSNTSSNAGAGRAGVGGLPGVLSDV